MSLTLKEIYEGLTDSRIIELVMSLGADRYMETDKEIIFPTICHNYNASQASMKLYYYKRNKMFHCYTGDCESFNIFGLFERRYELLHKEYDFYQDIVLKVVDGMDLSSNDDDSFYEKYESPYTLNKNKTIVNLKKYNKTILGIFSKDLPIEWLNEGISEKVMKQFNICYYISQHKIVIPHYDIDGNLVGIRGRSLDEEDILVGKYMPLKINGVLYNHPLMFNLYGLNFNKEAIKKNKMAVITEGEKSVLLYGSYYEDNICVATCGSSLHKYQIDLLTQNGAETIILAYDKEGKDSKEKNLYYKKLIGICKKYSAFCKIGFIYDEKGLLKLKDSPLDRGKKVYEELLKGVVWC